VEAKIRHNRRVKTPTVLQMEAVESGAASLAMILCYYGRFVPLLELRKECGVSRDGTKSGYILKAARKYGLEGKEIQNDPESLKNLPLPMIVFLDFTRYVVFEGIKKDKVFINDPESGSKVISLKEFDGSFTGLTLTFKPGPDFKRGGNKPSLFNALKSRLTGSKTALAYVMLAGLFLVFPGLVVPVFSKIFVDDILVKQMNNWLGPLLIGMGVAAVMRAFLTWLQKYYLLRLETKLALSSSAKFFYHVFYLPVEFFNQRLGGEIVNRVQINDRVAQLLSGDLATNMLNMVMIVFYAAMMFHYDVAMTLVGIFIVMFNLAALRFFSNKRANLVQNMLQAQGKSLGVAINGLQMIETLKASGSESDFFARWAGFQTKGKNAEQELGVSSNILTTIPFFLSGLNGVVILALGAVKIMNGHMSIGSLIAFQSLMASFVEPVNQVVNLGSQIQEVRGDMNRLDDVLDHPLDKQFLYGEKNIEKPEKIKRTEKIKLSGRLELKNITFGYNTLEPPLIENFNLLLKPGARVALVGSSGSGKSTIAKLVTCLYEPWSGEILFDGKKRSSISRRLLTGSVAMVDQDIFMFEGTVGENLTMWDDTIAKTKIIEAAKDACIHDDIAQRAGGYDSKVVEGCSNYSGGQRQRLEIARALASDPTILVLDEATSALDPKTEKIVDDNLRRRGCTCIIIAHRLSTIRDCDEIIVLEKGKVVQRGTHDEMINKEGVYANLVGAG